MKIIIGQKGSYSYYFHLDKAQAWSQLPLKLRAQKYRACLSLASVCQSNKPMKTTGIPAIAGLNESKAYRARFNITIYLDKAWFQLPLEAPSYKILSPFELKIS